MNVSHLLEVRPAPCAVFDHLATHRDRPRFHVRDGAGWRPVTWGRFATEIRGVARWLIDQHAAPPSGAAARSGEVGPSGHELRPGERVAILAPNSVAWASAALGTQTAGGVVVPIYPASTAEQIHYILEHAEIRFVFVAGAELKARLGTGRFTVHDLADAEPIAAAAARDAATPHLVDARLAALDLDAPAQMLYTSGTSGNPKGVPLTHRNVGKNGADWLQCNAPLLAEGDRDLLWLPMSHIFGFGELCLGNTLAWESYLTSPAEVLELLPRVAPHVFMSVPAYWEKIARAIKGADLKAVTGGNLRFCLSGGAGLKVEIKEQLHAAGLLVLEGYGLTETSPTLTLNRPASFRFDTVGKTLPSVELRLDVDGEILARGDNVFRGYFKDPAATAAAFTEDGWFRTGDVGRWTEDGFLQIIDRKKDILVSSGGKNIPPANIEARFVDDPVIERLVVYGDARPYLVAAVWPRAGATAAQIAERVTLVNGELARHETIKRHFVADVPLTVEAGLLTASLKLRRKAVYEHLRARFESLYSEPPGEHVRA